MAIHPKPLPALPEQTESNQATRIETIRSRGFPGTKSLMAIKSRGTVRTTPTQNRRVISTSSGFFFFFERNSARFERHAADGTVAGFVTHDLRMHRAGVFDLLGWRLRRNWLQRHPTLWTRTWFVLANFGMHRTRVKFGVAGTRPGGFNLNTDWPLSLFRVSSPSLN